MKHDFTRMGFPDSIRARAKDRICKGNDPFPHISRYYWSVSVSSMLNGRFQLSKKGVNVLTFKLHPRSADLEAAYLKAFLYLYFPITHSH